MTVRSAVSILSQLKNQNSYAKDQIYAKGLGRTVKVLHLSETGELSLGSKPGFWKSILEWFFGKDKSRDLGAIGKKFEATFTQSADYADLSVEDLKAARIALSALRQRSHDKQAYEATIQVIDTKIKEKEQPSKPAVPLSKKPVAVKVQTSVLTPIASSAKKFSQVGTTQPQDYRSFFGKLMHVASLQKNAEAGLFEQVLTRLEKDAEWKPLMEGFKNGTLIDPVYQAAIIVYFEQSFGTSPEPISVKPRTSSTDSVASIDSGYSTGNSSVRNNTPESPRSPSPTDSGYVSKAGSPEISRSPSPRLGEDIDLQAVLERNKLTSQFKTLQAAIKRLDPGSKNFLKDLKEIKEAFKKLVDNQETAPFFTNLDKLIDVLMDPKSFTVSEETDLLLNLLARDFAGNYSKDDTVIRSQRSMAISSLVKLLKANVEIDKMASLQKRIPDEVKKHKDIILDTVIGMLKGTPVAKEEIKKAVRQMQVLAKKTEEALEEAFDVFKETMNARTEGRFEKIVAVVGFLNPLSITKETVEVVLEEFYQDHVRSYVTGKGSLPSREVIEGFALERAIETLDPNAPTWNWILENYRSIVRSYDQFTDIDRNAGGGTCFNNSVDRIQVLVVNPKVDPSGIEMASSAKGRFDIAQVDMSNISGTDQIVNYIEKSNLKIVSARNPVNSIVKSVKEAIETTPSPTPKQILFVMTGGPTAGHAINLLIKNNEIWVFDDNFGILRFDSLDAGRKSVASYIKAFYGEEYKTFFSCTIAAK